MPEPQTLMTGITFGESPRWHDRLYFADWGTQQLVAVDLEGKSEVVAGVPSSPFCFDRMPDGRLLIVSGGDGRLLRREPDGSLPTYADLGRLSQYPWNEIVVDGRGNTYVDNIGFDFPEGEPAPGMLVLVAPDGSIRQVADGLAFPNGIVVTPDNSTLIVAESYGNRLTAFDIADDGDLSNRRVWANVGGDHPDGICLDAEGAVWYADVGTRRCVRVREGGEVLQTVDLDLGCFACMLGGPDGRTLFMVATDYDPAAMFDGERTGRILTTRAPSPGAGWPKADS